LIFTSPFPPTCRSLSAFPPRSYAARTGHPPRRLRPGRDRHHSPGRWSAPVGRNWVTDSTDQVIKQAEAGTLATRGSYVYSTLGTAVCRLGRSGRRPSELRRPDAHPTVRAAGDDQHQHLDPRRLGSPAALTPRPRLTRPGASIGEFWQISRYDTQWPDHRLAQRPDHRLHRRPRTRPAAPQGRRRLL